MDEPRKPLPSRVDATPPLTSAYQDALTMGLASLRFTLSSAASAAIEGHARLLLAWTSEINLTGIRDPAGVALGHVVDSLSAAAILRERGVRRFLDIGSGGGYPGVPLAVALPAERALLLEPIQKKARFLSTVVAAMGLEATVEVAPVRIEALAADARHRGQWPAVVARAIGSLGELVELAFPVLAPGGILVAWKRGDVELELAAAERAMGALGGGRLEVHPVMVPGLDHHCLVVATVKGVAPAAYPREPGVRGRRPW